MVKESVKEEQYKLVVGVAIESMRVDLLGLAVEGCTKH